MVVAPASKAVAVATPIMFLYHIEATITYSMDNTAPLAVNLNLNVCHIKNTAIIDRIIFVPFPIAPLFPTP